MEKKIHYCWFGGNPLPDLAVRCIQSWKRFFPDYEIVEWNESNFDINENEYIKKAYENKKYAFVSDYARFYILYNYGGIYFDTDVEVINDMSHITEKGPFLGLEEIGAVNPGLGFSGNRGDDFLKEVLESYKDSKFIDENGILNEVTIVSRVSKILRKYGLEDKNTIQNVKGYTIYPTDYFCPKNYFTGEMLITENSCSIHHYDGSWTTKKQQLYNSFRIKIYKKYPKNIAKIICFFPLIILKFKENGVKGFIVKIVRNFKKR